MTTRNQKKKQSANLKPSSSNPNGVDFQKAPIVALPASNPQSDSQSGLPLVTAATNSAANQVESTPGLHPSSSPTAAKTPATAAAAKPVRNCTSNPVVRDICALKSGKLKIVSPAVSKYFGFPAGPVSNLDFSDPKVAEFFDVPVAQQPEKIVAGHGASGSAETVVSTVQIAAVAVPSSPTNVLIQGNAELTQGNHITQPSNAAVGNSGVGPDCTARPTAKAAGIPPTTSQSTSQATWAGLFKGNRALTDDAILRPNYVGVTSEKVVLDDDDLEDDGEEKRSLIGFFNGKFPGTNAIQHIVDDWSRKCSFHRHNSGWLVFTFDEEVDCDIVLKEGPYYAFNKPLVLKKMPEFFDFSDEAYSTAPVWIQLPNLPLRAWKKSALEKICSYLGTPLQLDQVTKEKERKSFARCLVEIDVSKDLPNLVCCDLPRGKVLRQHVLYEETPTFCCNCKKLGHDSEDCYANNNGVPSLYVARNKKEKEKIRNKHVEAGARKGMQPAANASAKDRPVSGQAKATDTAPAAAAALASTSAASNKDNGTVLPQGMAGGNLGSGLDSRHPTSSKGTSALHNQNGKSGGTLGREPGVASANSFGPLANEKVGNGSDEVEASNARDNNKKKNNNGTKK